MIEIHHLPAMVASPADAPITPPPGHRTLGPMQLGDVLATLKLQSLGLHLLKEDMDREVLSWQWAMSTSMHDFGRFCVHVGHSRALIEIRWADRNYCYGKPAYLVMDHENCLRLRQSA
jgi:hypothetical protein